MKKFTLDLQSIKEEICAFCAEIIQKNNCFTIIQIFKKAPLRCAADFAEIIQRGLGKLSPTSKSHNHQLSWWLEEALEGHITNLTPKGAPKGLPTAFFSPATP